jgi:hypothetical protein
MSAPKIPSASPSMRSLDDEAARRWGELRHALGERSWPMERQTAPTLIDRDRLNKAAERALNLYPGPVGELVHREIQAYLNFGQGFAQASLITRLVEDIVGAPTD